MEITRFQRFLKLGTEGTLCRAGSFAFAPEDALETAAAIRELGSASVDLIISPGRRCAQVYALALAASIGDSLTRRAALAQLPTFLRSSEELFAFCEACRGLRGWGRGLRTAIGRWYNARTPEGVAAEVARCPESNGWSHRDLLRLSHPTPPTAEHRQVYEAITAGRIAPAVQDASAQPEPGPSLVRVEKRTLIAIDASTSMHGFHWAQAAELANRLSDVTEATVIAFDQQTYPLSRPVTQPPQSGGWVDHAVPFREGADYDAVVVITDADTWNAPETPDRLSTRIGKVVVVGFGLRPLFGELEDAEVLHIVGYDGSVSALILAFIA